MLARVSPGFGSLLARVHGHLGWLAVAALAHPAYLLRTPGRRARVVVIASTSLVVLAAVLGGVVYGPYRERVRAPLFAERPAVGWLFERKEHLAFGAVCLAIVGALAHVLATNPNANEPAGLEKVAFRAYVAAFGLAFVVACLGTYVSSVKPL